MVEQLEVGMKLQAVYSLDGEYYPAQILAISEGKKRAKAPVQVEYIGYNDSAWVSVDSLKSRKLKNKKPAKAAAPAPKAKAKVKAKAKAKASKEYDYSGLEKGMRVQAQSSEDGVYYAAEVVTVAKGKQRAEAPVKVHYVGYTNASDEWVGGDRLRSKALTTRVPIKEMPQAAKKLLLVSPKILPPLDKGFKPVVLAKKAYAEATKECTDKLVFALKRADGCGRGEMAVFEEKSREISASIYMAGILIQEMLWQRSGSELILFGPSRICKALAKDFAKGGRYEFEVKSMPNVCGTPETPFQVTIADKVEDVPEEKNTVQTCGKDASGCRLAFDLGKSDIKTVAIKDNEVLYSKETEWDVTNKDPQYHFDAIVAAMKLAAEKLPKIDAIGGSATGTVSAKNEATWCDIFPNVPPAVYKEKVVDIFIRIAKEVAGKEVPLKVINDGEVTALAAFQKIKAGNIMGISMGSSEGGGYADKDGNLPGWINELCYLPLDLNPKAPTDPWTKGAHTGISHMYLGQRGTTKLAARGGVDVPANLKYPHKDMCTITHENHAQCLKLIQEAMKDPEKEEKVKQIYETVGVYLGYGLAQYCEFYAIEHVMILGRVSKGKGGDIMLDMAKKVLEEEFPEYSKIQFHTADDHFKAVGQCIAAAALPSL